MAHQLCVLACVVLAWQHIAVNTCRHASNAVDKAAHIPAQLVVIHVVTAADVVCKTHTERRCTLCADASLLQTCSHLLAVLTHWVPSVGSQVAAKPLIDMHALT